MPNYGWQTQWDPNYTYYGDDYAHDAHQDWPDHSPTGDNGNSDSDIDGDGDLRLWSILAEIPIHWAPHKVLITSTLAT